MASYVSWDDAVAILVFINIRAKSDFHLIVEGIAKLDREEIDNAIAHLELVNDVISLKKTRKNIESPRLKLELEKQMNDVVEMEKASVYNKKCKTTFSSNKRLPYTYLNQKILVNYPPQNLCIFITLPLLIFSLLNFPSLISYVYLRGIHEELEKTFQSAISINIASSSVIMLNAMNYLHYYHKYTPKETVFDSDTDLDIIHSLERTVEAAKNIAPEGYFQEKLNTHICDRLEYFAPDLPFYSNQTDTCIYSTSDIPNFNFVMALNKLLTNVVVTTTQLLDGTELPITEYFGHPDFIKNDLLGVYTSLTLQRFSEESVVRILADIEHSSTGTSLTIAGLIGCLILFCWLFKKYYVHRRLSWQHKANMSIAIVNDKLMDNSYIKRLYSKYYSTYT